MEINFLLWWQKLYSTKINTFMLDTSFTTQQYSHNCLHDLALNFCSLEQFHEFQVKYPIKGSAKCINEKMETK